MRKRRLADELEADAKQATVEADDRVRVLQRENERLLKKLESHPAGIDSDAAVLKLRAGNRELQAKNRQLMQRLQEAEARTDLERLASLNDVAAALAASVSSLDVARALTTKGAALVGADGADPGGRFEAGESYVVFSPVVPGDLDGDGSVGILDFLQLLASWGSCPQPCPPSCPADLDGDCQVGIVDFLVLLGNWG